MAVPRLVAHDQLVCRNPLPDTLFLFPWRFLPEPIFSLSWSDSATPGSDPEVHMYVRLVSIPQYVGTCAHFDIAEGSLQHSTTEKRVSGGNIGSIKAKIRVCCLTILEQINVVRHAVYEFPKIHSCTPPHISGKGFFVVIGSVI